MLTVTDAARLAERDPETIRRWIRAGRLTAWKVGGQHMIDEDDLAAILRATPSTAPALARTPSVPRVGEAAAPYLLAARRAPAPAPAMDPWLPRIVGRVVRASDPARIVLFGDHLRGASGPDVDYKLLVLLDDVADRWSRAADIRLSFGELPVLSEVIVATVDELDGGPTRPTIGPIALAARDGVSVYDRAGDR